MNLDELWNLCGWVDREVVQRRILEKYQALASILRANTQSNQPRQPFESQKSDLVDSMSQIQFQALTRQQVDFLERVRLAQHLGGAGIQELEGFLFRNSLDIVTAAQSAENIAGEVSTAQSRLQQLRVSLDGLISPPESVQPGEAILRVTFAGDAAIANVADLKRWGEKWYGISRGIAMAQGESPESVRVIGASRGSIVLELAGAYAFVHLTSKIILRVIKVADRVLDIRMKAAEIRALNLENDKLALELEKEARREQSAGIAATSIDITRELNLVEGAEGDKVVALKASIKTLVEFLTNGGGVDCVLPTDAQTPPDGADNKDLLRADISKAFLEIRAIEAKQRLLKHDPNRPAN